MSEKKNKKGLIAIIVVAVVIVAAIVSFVVWKTRPRGMTVAVSELPDSLNPVLEQNTSGLNANELLFDGLVNLEVKDGRLVAEYALAEYIEQDEVTRKDYRATLRDGLVWHDGEKVTADDVVFSYKAYTLAENKSPMRDYLNAFIKDVVAESDNVVRIEFKKPIPEHSAIYVLTFKIIPQIYNKVPMNVNLREGENERAFATKPIGTGPFKLKSWDIGKWLTFEANGMYKVIKHEPQADSFVIKRTIDPVVRRNELRKGRINLITETSPTDREVIAKIKNVDINSYMPFAFYQIEINMDRTPSADARKAMAYALHREDLVPGTTDTDIAVLNYGPFPANTFQLNAPEYNNDELPHLLSYDKRRAINLASSSGLSGQNYNLLYPDSMGEFGKALAEGVAAQLGEIGVNVEVKRTGDQVFEREVYKNKNYDIALVYHDGFDSGYSSIGNLYRSNGSENLTGIADKKLDAMFDSWEKIDEMVDWIDETLALNAKISDICPALYLCTIKKDVYSRGLKNVTIASDNPFLSAEDWQFTN